MEKTVGIEEARKTLGHMVDDVRQKGDWFVLSKKGKRSAALVPLRVLELYRKTKHDLLKMIEEVHERNRSRSPEEIEKVVDEAIAAVRAKSSI